MNIGNGCGNVGCRCTYCNGDNYDRYMFDELSLIMEEINNSLERPIRIDDDNIKHNEEKYYVFIKNKVLQLLTN